VAVPDRPLRPLLAVCCAAALLAGCGAAAGSDKGSVSVSVTRDFGARAVVSSPPVGIDGTTPLFDVLDRVTDTREGTRSITSIDGVDGAWRLWVNGVRVPNAQKAKVRPGDRVWLDLPGAGVTASIPAVTGSFPEPFLHGVDGKRIPVRVECSVPSSRACDAAVKKLSDLGVVAARGGINAGVNDLTIRVLVGTWSTLRATRDDAVRRMDRGPSSSGIFARFDADGRTLDVLDGSGRPAQSLAGDTGLVAATKIAAREPVWFVTGTDEAGVEAAASALDEATLTTDYALAVHDDRGVAVPAR
jgi:hypothetical protein